MQKTAGVEKNRSKYHVIKVMKTVM